MTVHFWENAESGLLMLFEAWGATSDKRFFLSPLVPQDSYDVKELDI